MQRLINEKILAVPKLHLSKIPENTTLKKLIRYKDVYQQGIVNNRTRNGRILTKTLSLVTEGRTVLIIVSQIEHGHNLINTANFLNPDLSEQMIFIYGDTDTKLRESVKAALNLKKFKVVITSLIWKEGVNIPTLGAVINAAGGKSELSTLQALGRGLRVAPGKEDIVFCDFFDNSHHYLISHFGERLSLYFDLGWL